MRSERSLYSGSCSRHDCSGPRRRSWQAGWLISRVEKPSLNSQQRARARIHPSSSATQSKAAAPPNATPLHSLSCEMQALKDRQETLRSTLLSDEFYSSNFRQAIDSLSKLVNQGRSRLEIIETLAELSRIRAIAINEVRSK